MYKYFLLFLIMIWTIMAQETIFSFTEKNNGWYSVNDNVMGGISQGGAKMTAEQTMMFSGELSLKNNGGFSSIRSPFIKANFKDYTGIAVRVKGDGRLYYFNIYTDVRIPAGSYRSTIQTIPGKWVELFLPFSKFQATSFGRKIPFFPALNKNKIKRMGFMAADKKEGNFALEIAWIKAAKKLSDDAPKLLNSADWLQKNGSTSVFWSLVEGTSFEKLLRRDLSCTIFAVVDESFATYPKKRLEMLRRNHFARNFFLATHIRVGRIPLTSQIIPSRVPAFEVSEKNIYVANGIIHTGTATSSALKTFLQKMSRTEFIQYVISIGSATFNVGYPEICQDIYYLGLLFIMQNFDTTEELRNEIDKALQLDEKNSSGKAWEFRYLLDKIYALGD
ncbi:CIA30 family protein [Candidatus Uabimicrobium amorphum]|uniref:NADH:ubiquinone oxidoreductase n=1 Tax=Uabimicrobium amorphum TaxID=2596890 RepID=A0A5S9F137_UABAM|nr:CIA30 family protein [Candidatus Uabimicrobium amorphum]BBM81998.1 NADH:ubiquinone oxidoreductase [Candidatus Uabimicrobium amorphum]